MKHLLLILIGFCFSTISIAQSNNSKDLTGTDAILKELVQLESKIKKYKSQISSSSKEDNSVSELYDMNYDLESNLNNISDIIYQMSIDEIAEEPIFGGTENEENDYKGDFELGGDLKSKVMKSLDDFAFVLGWGINSMTYEGENEIPHHLWGSSNWEFGFVNKRQIGETRTRFVYGLTLNTHYFKLDDADILNSKTDPGYTILEDTDFKKVRFGVRYLQVPLGFGIKVGKKAELFLGGHVGFKVKGYTKKEYESALDEDVEADLKATYGLNKFNYGGDISFGVKSLRLFGKYDFNPLFKDGSKHNIYTVGLRYGY